MTRLSIITPHRRHSTRVESYDQIKDLIEPMHETLEHISKTGVALHHSQVDAKPFDFFVIRRSTLKNSDTFATFCNARIIEKDPESVKMMREGCLSWPFRPTKDVRRYGKVKVEYDVIIPSMNVPGEVLMKHEECWVEGLLAQIFQHEIGHGNGVHIY